MGKSMEIMAEEIAAQAKIFEYFGADVMKQVSEVFQRPVLLRKLTGYTLLGAVIHFMPH